MRENSHSVLPYEQNVRACPAPRGKPLPYEELQQSKSRAGTTWTRLKKLSLCVAIDNTWHTAPS